MNRLFPNVPRRDFLKGSAATAVGVVFGGRSLYAPLDADAETQKRLPHDFATKVRPLVGTGWAGFVALQLLSLNYARRSATAGSLSARSV